jgi:hypothetical protein
MPTFHDFSITGIELFLLQLISLALVAVMGARLVIHEWNAGVDAASAQRPSPARTTKVPLYEAKTSRAARSPRRIQIVDPFCGAGTMMAPGQYVPRSKRNGFCSGFARRRL